MRSVAADLGVDPETLRNWVRAAGTSRPRGRRAEVPEERPTPLEAENAALRRSELEERARDSAHSRRGMSGVTAVAWDAGSVTARL
ncbi:transposase [Streptomyces sp. CA-210063]|uniref:transposase n=1 Tax=Streptomyces sp. CA-210063 TaxID=2801029 RepID=UPI003FA71419